MQLLCLLDNLCFCDGLHLGKPEQQTRFTLRESLGATCQGIACHSSAVRSLTLQKKAHNCEKCVKDVWRCFSAAAVLKRANVCFETVSL